MILRGLCIGATAWWAGPSGWIGRNNIGIAVHHHRPRGFAAGDAARGGKTGCLGQRLNAKTRKIIKEHKPVLLAPEKKQKVQEILAGVWN